MAQRRISEYFPINGVTRTIGNDLHSDSPHSRENSSYGGSRGRGSSRRGREDGGSSRGGREDGASSRGGREDGGSSRGGREGGSSSHGRREGGGSSHGRRGGGGSSRGGREGGGERGGGGRGSDGRRREGGGGGEGRRRSNTPNSPSIVWREATDTLPALPPTREVRAALCVQVLRESGHILSTTPAGSSNSIYYPTLLPSTSPLPLPPPPTATSPLPPPTIIKVIDGDTYTVAQTLLHSDSNRQGKVSVMNLASEYRPGGGWKKGSLAQEESLCYRSTLYVSLDKDPSHYPLHPLGCVFSPTVVIYRHEMSQGFAMYTNPADRFVVGVVSIAGLRTPEINPRTGRLASRELQVLLEDKIRQTLRVLIANGQEYIVLGALGCGAFKNPPELVAGTFKKVLKEPEWRGRFRQVVFAVMAGSGRQFLAKLGAGKSSQGEGTEEEVERREEAMEVDGDDEGRSREMEQQEMSPGRKNFLVFKECLDGVVIG